jgi:lipoprotein NlpI
MKAYQVFTGESDKHGRQQYDLVATYLDRERALQHCKEIAESTQLYGDILEETEFYANGKYKSWTAIGWERVDIAQFQEIEITE